MAPPRKKDPLEQRYPELARLVVGSCPIPFLDTPYVPQGICWLPGGLVAMAFYMKGAPSRLALVKFATGKVRHCYDLRISSGQPYKGHASGITVHGDSLWLTGHQCLHRFALQDVLAGQGAELRAVSSIGADANGSFLSSDGERLWTGDFVKRPSLPQKAVRAVLSKLPVRQPRLYSAPKHHASSDGVKFAWAAACELNEAHRPTSRKYEVGGKKVFAPSTVIHLRQKVQGFAVCGDVVALSVSYSHPDSKLAFYAAPFGAKPRRQRLPKGHVPAFVVDDDNHLETIDMPAGSQDLSWDGERLLVTFEGANQKFRDRWTAQGAGIEGRALALRLPEGLTED